MDLPDEYNYTEISGRMSGKTTRLVSQFARDVLKDSGSKGPSQYIIVSPNYNMRDYILGLVMRMATEFLERKSDSFTAHKVKGAVFSNSFDFLRSRRGVRVYFDEFDHCRWKQEGINNLKFGAKWAKSIYACTTPDFARDPNHIDLSSDPIPHFVSFSEGQYSNYYNKDLPIDNYPSENLAKIHKYGLFVSPKSTTSLD